jgi:hypothetical protein
MQYNPVHVAIETTVISLCHGQKAVIYRFRDWVMNGVENNIDIYIDIYIDI